MAKQKSNNKGVDLGDEVKDMITGYTGIVIAVTYWINGCVRLELQSQTLKDGVPVHPIAIDVEQAEVLTQHKVPMGEPSGGPAPSPSLPTPSRNNMG